MTTNLESYLAHYKQCDAPGYAVLVTGDWGVGKTYQVKRILNEKEVYYISLFGLQTAEDVHSEVFTLMDPEPARAIRLFSRLEEAARDVGGLPSLLGLVPGMLRAAVRQEIKSDKIIVFDDLERCGLKIKDILGLVNLYVEHHKCSVIVIAHDTKLTKRFDLLKEKIFGHTIRVYPETEDAFDGFVSSMPSDEAREFLRKHKSRIIDVFKTSKSHSLRVMRHLIEDLGRLCELLEEEHIACDEAMEEMVPLFSSLNIEVRQGNLSRDDLIGREEKRYSYALLRHADGDREQEKPKIAVADEKYPSFDLCSNLIQDHVIADMLIDGRYERHQIQNSLNSSSYFMVPEQAPPWKTVIKFDDLEDDIVDAAKERMQRQFDDREVTNSGELLHIFALRLLMANEGIIDQDLQSVEAECRTYVDDLLGQRRLPPRDTDYLSRYDYTRSHDGHAYYVPQATAEHFNHLMRYLTDKREEALLNELPELAQKLLALVGTDGQAFFEQVCYTNAGNNPYVSVPILSRIEPAEFVQTLLGTPKRNWNPIYLAFKERYRTNGLADNLSDEADWLREVVRLLDAEAEAVGGFASLRIRRLIAPEVRGILNNLYNDEQ